jgi:hypothetical protein
MLPDYYEKLRYLSLVVREQCKKNHITLVFYVLSRAKGKQTKEKMAEFQKLSAVNDALERNYNAIFSKYTRQLEGRPDSEAVVTPDELLAFTKAYELQKDELKKEIEMLTFMGASNSLIEPVEQDLLTWAQFHSEFYTYIQEYKSA